MRKLAPLLVALTMAFGCSRHHGVDTGALASSFKTAEPTLKSEADTAVKAIKAGNFPDALNHLQALSKRAKLSAEQQQAIADTITQIQKQMEIAAAKAAADTKKALPAKK